jgi:DNA modification methylase
MEKSLSKFGAGRSILIDKNNRIIAGNKTTENFGELGLEDVQIVETDGKTLIAVRRNDIDLDTPEGREFALADNQTAKSNIDFDFDYLESELGEDTLEEWGIEIPEEEVLEAEEDDFNEAPPEEPITVLGDLIEIGEHRLLCGDSTDSDQVAKLMNGEKADMVFTDPPYGMSLDVSNSNNLGSKGKWKNKAKNYTSVIGDGEDFTNELIDTIFINFDYVKEVFIWGADYFAELIPNRKAGSWLVWDKRAGVEDMKLTFSEFELCWSKEKHLREVIRITWSGILGTEQEFDHKRHHPTQKPTKLSRWFIQKHSQENQLITDIYLGSGSTMVASHQLKRKCYGMELDPKYCDVIIKRMLKLDGTLTLKVNGVVTDPTEY